MAIDLNDEIVQDFLVEGGEILDLLGEQLVDLETQPEDTELLNAIFRGFHTIKGGAGFLALDGMVTVCHRAEDIFNLLRQGELPVEPELMDLMLRVLDVVNAMFEQLRSGEEPPPAEPELIAQLVAVEQGEAQVEEAAPAVAETPVSEATVDLPDTAVVVEEDEKTVREAAFDSLLSQMHDGSEVTEETTPAASTESAAGSTDDITDDEFEALLDELHGNGAKPPIKANDSASADEISDDEFEALLDELHGTKADPKAQPATVAPAEPAVAVTPPPPAPKPAAAPKPPAPVAKRAKAPAKPPRQPKGETTVRVDTGVLDKIMNMVGELVLVRNRLTTLETTLSDERAAEAIGSLDLVTGDLQSAVMKTRMQPIKKVFGRFPRVVRDLARTLGKEIELVMVGEETDLDKNLVEALADPMVHLVRNSVDHGIESPDDREAAGKPRKGTVTLAAEQEGDHILLTVSDDGKGMDAEVLRGKAVEKGLMDEEAAARLSDHECYNLIFAAGFSTKTEISDVSGRGVGMDVVKTGITQLNGSVDVQSSLGKGSTIVIKVPLTLAIVPTLMVVLGKQIYALPLVNVKEIFDLEQAKINLVDGHAMVMVRGAPLPLFYLKEWLNPPADEESKLGHVLVVHVGNKMICLVVDNLLGQQEVVIKPLGALLQGTKGMAGATITGDGRIALILDVPGLLDSYVGGH